MSHQKNQVIKIASSASQAAAHIENQQNGWDLARDGNRQDENSEKLGLTSWLLFILYSLSKSLRAR